MPEFPDTSESLLARVRDPSDQAAWDRFEELYRPVVFRIARARGLQHSDALDLVQQVLLSVSSAISTFEKQEDGARFRHWLSRVTRNAILKALARGERGRGVGGSEILNVLQGVAEADPATDALIDLEYRRELYLRAGARVRAQVQESTWLAFEFTVLQGLDVPAAARSLGLSTGSVYAARSRVMRRLRDAIRMLEHTEGLPDLGDYHEPK